MTKIGNIPLGIQPDLRQRLNEMKSAIEVLQPNPAPPDTPTNLVVTPISGGNQITFTRSQNADGYILRISATPSWSAASGMQRDLGDSNVVEDFCGKGGVQRFYQVVAYKQPLLSRPTAAKAGTSLALGTDATVPAAPPSAVTVVVSSQTGLPVAVQPRGAGKLKE